LRQRHGEWKAASKENRAAARQSVQDALRAFDDFVLQGRLPESSGQSGFFASNRDQTGNPGYTVPRQEFDL